MLTFGACIRLFQNLSIENCRAEEGVDEGSSYGSENERT